MAATPSVKDDDLTVVFGLSVSADGFNEAEREIGSIEKRLSELSRSTNGKGGGFKFDIKLPSAGEVIKSLTQIVALYDRLISQVSQFNALNKQSDLATGTSQDDLIHYRTAIARDYRLSHDYSVDIIRNEISSISSKQTDVQKFGSLNEHAAIGASWLGLSQSDMQDLFTMQGKDPHAVWRFLMEKFNAGIDAALKLADKQEQQKQLQGLTAYADAMGMGKSVRQMTQDRRTYPILMQGDSASSVLIKALAGDEQLSEALKNYTASKHDLGTAKEVVAAALAARTSSVASGVMDFGKNLLLSAAGWIAGDKALEDLPDWTQLGANMAVWTGTTPKARANTFNKWQQIGKKDVDRRTWSRIQKLNNELANLDKEKGSFGEPVTSEDHMNRILAFYAGQTGIMPVTNVPLTTNNVPKSWYDASGINLDVTGGVLNPGLTRAQTQSTSTTTVLETAINSAIEMGSTGALQQVARQLSAAARMLVSPAKKFTVSPDRLLEVYVKGDNEYSTEDDWSLEGLYKYLRDQVSANPLYEDSLEVLNDYIDYVERMLRAQMQGSKNNDLYMKASNILQSVKQDYAAKSKKVSKLDVSDVDVTGIDGAYVARRELGSPSDRIALSDLTNTERKNIDERVNSLDMAGLAAPVAWQNSPQPDGLDGHVSIVIDVQSTDGEQLGMVALSPLRKDASMSLHLSNARTSRG